MNDMHHPFVWLDGRCQPAAEARLPINDRAFRYGDGLFETLRVQGGTPEFWNAHLSRLAEGLRALRFPDLDFDLPSAARELLRANVCEDAVLRIALSRGEGGYGYLPHRDTKPLLLLQTFPLPAQETRAVTLWHASLRRPGPQHLPTHCKLSSALGSVLARMEAEEQRCDEALMTDREGHVSEASAANIFWQEADGRLFTSALQSGAVAGIARHILLQSLPVEALPVEECLLPLERLKEATAVILCNSLRYAQPVARLAPQNWHWHSTALAERCRTILADAACTSRSEFV